MIKKFMLTLIIGLIVVLSSCTTDDKEKIQECLSSQTLNSDGICIDNVISCEEGQILEDNICVDEEVDVICESDEILKNGICEDKPLECVDGYTEIQGYCIKNLDTEEEYEYFTHDGLERQYVLYIPETIEPDAPLVFMLHGLTGSATTIQRVSNMNELADLYGFAVVYPEGTMYEGVRFWNAGLDYSTVDDTGFLVALAEHLQETYDLSPLNTFSAGFSNGGFMSYKLACDANETFKAIGSVAGVMSLDTWNTCDDDIVPILHIHGDQDTVVPVDGSLQTVGGWGGAPELSVIINSWVVKDGLDNEEETIINASTTFYRYYNDETNDEVWYYQITDYNHIWPGSIDYNTGFTVETAGFYASDVIWDFFTQYVE